MVYTKMVMLRYLAICCSLLGITACTSGSSSNNSVTKASHVYITNNDSTGVGVSYTQCEVGGSGIESNTCVTIIPGGESNPLLNDPAGIAISNGYVYMLNNGSESPGISYVQCNLDVNGIESNTCVSVIPGGESSPLLNAPAGIAISNGYAYITNLESVVTQCLVGINGIKSNTCSNIKLSTLGRINTGIAINNGFIDITNVESAGYSQCNVGVNGIESSTCIRVTPGGASPSLPSPMAIVINDNYAYITNIMNDNYTQCNVGVNGMESNTCINIKQGGVSSLLNRPTGIAIKNGFVYILNSGANNYTQCVMGTFGIESATCINVMPTGIGALDGPGFIAFDQ